MATLINEGVKAWICILLTKVVIGREPHCTTTTTSTSTTTTTSTTNQRIQPDLQGHPLAAPAELQCGRTETDDRGGVIEHHDID